MKIIFITLLSITALGKTCTNENNEYLVWNKERKLSYADFKGVSTTNYGFEAQTVIRLRLNYKIEKYLKSFSVYCLFYKNESWIKNKIPGLLEHEQCHFDIGEIYAGKLRIELHKLQEQRVEVSYHMLDSMYKKINDDLFNRQTEYDEKTSHFLNAGQQEIWEKAVKEELKSLRYGQ